MALSAQRGNVVPRELVITSPRPISGADVVAAALACDPALTVHELWRGGSLQVSDAHRALLTVVRSVRIETDADVARFTDSNRPGNAFLTELYGPANCEATEQLIVRIARMVTVEERDGDT